MFDYEELKELYKIGQMPQLPPKVQLSCFVCGVLFIRPRYRVMCRLASGVQHAFCEKGCASSWTRSQEVERKQVIDCTYEDFLYGRIARNDHIALVKRPFYRLACSYCGKLIVAPWEQWRDNVRSGDLRAYCDLTCALASRDFQEISSSKLVKRKLRLDKIQAAIVTKSLVSYKGGASRRNLDWKLNRYLFAKLLFSTCFYCGGLPNPRNGIDRVDNSRGYLPDNVVPCCWRCNQWKSALSVGEFLSHINRIANYSRIQDLDASSQTSS